jgi:hypothetical protein
MPRREPAGREDAGAPPPGKVQMRLDANGRWVAVRPRPETTETTEAKPRPAQAEDPRTAPFRNIPPMGGA